MYLPLYYYNQSPTNTHAHHQIWVGKIIWWRGLLTQDGVQNDTTIYEMIPPFLQVIIIHSSDTDGRAILGRFQTTSQTNYDDVDARATVELIVEFEPKLESFTDSVLEMKTAQSRVYLLYAR